MEMATSLPVWSFATTLSTLSSDARRNSLSLVEETWESIISDTKYGSTAIGVSRREKMARAGKARSGVRGRPEKMAKEAKETKETKNGVMAARPSDAAMNIPRRWRYLSSLEFRSVKSSREKEGSQAKSLMEWMFWMMSFVKRAVEWEVRRSVYRVFDLCAVLRASLASNCFARAARLKTVGRRPGQRAIKQGEPQAYRETIVAKGVASTIIAIPGSIFHPRRI